ncbi:MAG: thrombospondin type 3 repeat-containing protein [Proteobacteria bacterium]|nr:thrombospondin type 3 repeat-containing protein [Pseudomonadota bacterium]MBU1687964.1 thrombospondin type 3 repeat-containing protein [Pseudomonadota bacterium]
MNNVDGGLEKRDTARQTRKAKGLEAMDEITTKAVTEMTLAVANPTTVVGVILKDAAGNVIESGMNVLSASTDCRNGYDATDCKIGATTTDATGMAKAPAGEIEIAVSGGSMARAQVTDIAVASGTTEVIINKIQISNATPTNVGSDPTADADDDGVFDATDNCPTTANASQTDTDGDGKGDACDDLTDSDKDGIADSADNCPSTANSSQKDTDGDGMGDACDGLTDSDDDGIDDATDNCPSTANSSQKDTDGDGMGDACDGLTDSDDDGVDDTNDNCPSIANADQADSDHNGIGDVCDTQNVKASILCTQLLGSTKHYGCVMYNGTSLDFEFESNKDSFCQYAGYDFYDYHYDDETMCKSSCRLSDNGYNRICDTP